PGCAAITGPTDGATDVACDVDITWDAVEDATGYRITIGTELGGTDVVDGEEVSGTAFVLPDGFAENTTHYVTVVPYNSAGEASEIGRASCRAGGLLVAVGVAAETGPEDGGTYVADDEGI